MDARPRKPGFQRQVRDIVQTGGGANGVTDFGDIRLLKRLIYAIGRGLPGGLDCGPLAGLTDFLDCNLQQKGRHFCRPSLLEKSK
jgi:hypothetical protein